MLFGHSSHVSLCEIEKGARPRGINGNLKRSRKMLVRGRDDLLELSLELIDLSPKGRALHDLLDVVIIDTDV